MVLFYEEKQEKPDTPTRRRLRLVRRIVFWLFVLSVIALWVLSRLGGNGEPLRLGMQDYLSQVSGMTAEIGDFRDMRFFPIAGIDIGDTTFTDSAGAPRAKLAHLRIRMNFWDVFFNRRRYHELMLSGLHLMPGGHLPGAVVIDSAGLSAEEKAFTLSGHYQERPFTLRLPVETAVAVSGVNLFTVPEALGILVTRPGVLEADLRRRGKVLTGTLRLQGRHAARAQALSDLVLLLSLAQGRTTAVPPLPDVRREKCLAGDMTLGRDELSVNLAPCKAEP